MMGIKKLSSTIKNTINYFYYLTSSYTKNVHPYKLIGEKINTTNKEVVIIFKSIGKQDLCELPLNQLLSRPLYISCFSPSDCFKLGNITFNNFIGNPNYEENIDTFNAMKKIMLTSTHDIYNFKHTIFYDSINYKENNISIEYIDYFNNIIKLNKYPFKLVGHKNKRMNRLETVIIYTILGRRDGYQQSLTKIACSQTLLDKFHPTEALKFGFVYTGDDFFYNFK